MSGDRSGEDTSRAPLSIPWKTDHAKDSINNTSSVTLS